MRNRHLGIILFLMLFFFYCNDYNPFSDSSNANIVVLAKTTFKRSDTIDIYSTKSLYLAPTVRELLDSFKISIESDRFHLTDTIVRDIHDNEYKFNISFYDTGSKHITITTYRKDGINPPPYDIQVYVKSPLAQNDLIGTVDQKLTFRTPPVGDSVYYNWSINGKMDIPDTFHLQYNEITPKIDIPNIYECRLWVSEDSLGKVHPSPGVNFQLTLQDSTGPFISCLNNKGDTIRTADDVFVFEAHISDAGGVKSADINGDNFEYVEGTSYKYTFRDMAAYGTAAKEVTIKATDINGNPAQKKYYLLYDEAGFKSSGTKLSFYGIDNSTTGQLRFKIAGNVYDQVHSSLTLTAQLNDREPQQQIVQFLNNSASWAFSESLSTNRPNSITVEAHDSTGAVLDRLDINVVYKQGAIDLTGPSLFDVKINGITAPLNNSSVITYIPSDTAFIRFVAFDASGIEKVTVNDSTANLEAGTLWRNDTITSIPHKTPAVITIYSIDSAGNKSENTFKVQENKLAAPSQAWIWPVHFIVGVPYSQIMHVVDEDDPLTVTMSDALPGMSIKQSGGIGQFLVNYTPTVSDLGPHHVKVFFFDNIKTNSIDWNFTVLADSSQLVQFESTENLFPRYAEATVPLTIPLKLRQSSGSAPFHFLIKSDRSTVPLLDTKVNSSSVNFSWTPPVSLIGLNRLTCIVTDNNSSSDTLKPLIEVVAKNSFPCKLNLSVPSTAIYNGRGEIVMYGATQALTLYCTVIDSDPPPTEKYNIDITRSSVTTHQVLDSVGTIAVRIEPKSDRLLDTIIIRVSDRTGSHDSVKIRITYLPIASNPASLSLSSTGLTFNSDNSIDMSAKTLPQIISINVIDADNPMSERYIFTTNQRGITRIDTIQDVNKYQYTFTPDPTRISDTLTIVIKDLSGSSDTLSYVVYYKKVIVRSLSINTTSANGGSAITSTVTSYPLLVRLDSSTIDFSLVKVTTPQITFSKTNGQSLPYEIERWDNTNKKGEIWIKMDTLIPGRLQTIAMTLLTEVSNASIGTEDIFDTSKGYAGAWHMGRFSSVMGVSTLLMKDASNNHNDFAPVNLSSSSFAEGIIGKSVIFNGDADYLQLPTPATSLKFSTAMTLSAWVKPSALDMSGYNDIIGRRVGTSWEDSWILGFHNSRPFISVGMDNDVDHPVNRIYGSATTNGQWTNITGVKNQTNLKLYVNGVMVAQSTTTSTSVSTDANTVEIGGQMNINNVTELFKGHIDETQASRVARNADWIKLSYDSQKAQSKVVTFK